MLDFFVSLMCVDAYHKLARNLRCAARAECYFITVPLINKEPLAVLKYIIMHTA